MPSADERAGPKWAPLCSAVTATSRSGRSWPGQRLTRQPDTGDTSGRHSPFGSQAASLGEADIVMAREKEGTLLHIDRWRVLPSWQVFLPLPSLLPDLPGRLFFPPLSRVDAPHLTAPAAHDRVTSIRDERTPLSAEPASRTKQTLPPVTRGNLLRELRQGAYRLGKAQRISEWQCYDAGLITINQSPRGARAELLRQLVSGR